MRVANFRKINIKSIPVYGMAQPAGDVSSNLKPLMLSSIDLLETDETYRYGHFYLFLEVCLTNI